MNLVPLQQCGTQSVPGGIPTPERGNDMKPVAVRLYALWVLSLSKDLFGDS